MAGKRQKISEGRGEQNIDDAAMRALMALSAMPNVTDQEFMTLLMRDPRDQQLYRAPAQTQGRRDTSSFDAEIYGKPQGIAHSHPMQRPTDTAPMTNFSSTDAAAAQAFGIPSYIVTLLQGTGTPEYRKLDAPPPEQQVRTRENDKQGIKGKEFLAQFPTDLMLEIYARDNPLRQALLADWRKAYQMGPPTRAEYYSGNSAAR